MLSQLDDIAVEVFKTGAASPRLCPNRMKNARTSPDRALVREFDVVDSDAELRTLRDLTPRSEQGEVQVCTSSPGDLGMHATGPRIIGLVVARA